MQTASAPTDPHSSSTCTRSASVRSMLPECWQGDLVRGKHLPQTSIIHNAHTHANDPSAGSPTETLLRLLLPLNDKVWTASRGIAAGEPAALPQSGGLTGSFNR